MARGASQSQTTSSSSSSRAGVAAPRGSAAAAAGMRRRRVLSSGSSSGGGSGSGIGAPGGNMLRFYTDDAPGLKISPTIVLVISLCFIGFVTALHVFGKLYRSKVSPWAYNPNKKKDRFLFRIFDSAVECFVSFFFFDISVNNHGRKKGCG
jgi:protein transport protein SEC61 subunit beta